jgi:signal transduction histidine kinase
VEPRAARRLLPSLAASVRAALPAAAVALAVALGCAPAGPAGSPLGEVTEAWFHPSAELEPPAPDDPQWRRVALPDFWGIGRRSQAREGWYRITFAARPDQPWAASVEGDWSDLHVFLNGRAQLHDREQYADLLPSEPPVLVLMPAHQLEPGDNQLLLRFETAVWRIGSLGPLLIGPAERVHAQRERKYLRQSVLPTSLTWFALACGTILALLARWEETRATGWFAAGTAAWCIPLLEPTRSLISVGHALPSSVLLHAFPPLFAIGFHRVLRLERPSVERVLLGSIVLGAAVRAFVPPILIPTVDWSWWVVDIGIALYLFQLALRTRRTDVLPYASGALLLAAALAIVAGIHDVSSLLARRPLLGFAFTPYVPAVLGLATVAALVSALGKRLADAQRLNLELERRVEEKRCELASSYARMAELERDRAIAAERERLMREMHDGTGGQIVSALAMVEGGTFERDAVVEALRDALADLRFSIDSLDPAEPDLLSLLGAARARLEPRLEARGLRFAWEVGDIPRPAHFGPETALQVLRIFQEAVVNALRHAQARVLTVRTGEERDATGAWVFVEVADDGKGFAPDAPEEALRAGGGRGLANMRRRAEAIGAQLSLASGPGGTTVRLRLPREESPALRA